jgi:tryptophanyl-tRNA synthetase
MNKPVILTGLRANNDLTIGNYFGSILPIIDMAKKRSDEYQINMFIPDLHSFTTPIDHSLLYDQILHNARLFTAAGLPLDNDDIYLYRQSYISAHSELTWILDCFTGFGEMSRMTQFKEKSRTDIHEIQLGSTQIGDPAIYSPVGPAQSVSVGLFNYPVLMAADILLYNAKYVPVGDDQTQHLEFTRDIAERINNKFGDIFTIPESVSRQHEFFGKDQGLRIKDLADPTKKMSKSDESGKGVIFLGDDPAVAAKKVMSATTDDKAEIHFDKVNQPGISNLLEILSLLREQPLAETVAEFEGQTRYGDFKQVVASEVEQFLTNFQQKLAMVDDTAIIAKLEQSERDLSQTANATLLRAQQAVGLRPRN